MVSGKNTLFFFFGWACAQEVSGQKKGISASTDEFSNISWAVPGLKPGKNWIVILL